MAFYNVHLPVGDADPADLAERATFLRQGFSWAAFLFGPLWLLWRGLWRALVLWCLATIIVSVAISDGVLRESAGTWFYLLGALFLGLQGRGLRAAAMERRGFRLVDVVSGSDLSSAESGFFSRWLAAAQPTAATPARRDAPIGEAHVIGLFPEAGG
jgi:Protein of unknown function (DUF2628)